MATAGQLAGGAQAPGTEGRRRGAGCARGSQRGAGDHSVLCCREPQVNVPVTSADGWLSARKAQGATLSRSSEPAPRGAEGRGRREPRRPASPEEAGPVADLCPSTRAASGGSAHPEGSRRHRVTRCRVALAAARASRRGSASPSRPGEAWALPSRGCSVPPPATGCASQWKLKRNPSKTGDPFSTGE